MKNIKKRICDDINSIIPDDKRKKEIYINIIETKNKKKFIFKPVLATCLIILCFISVIGIVYADEIENTFRNLVVKYIEKENEEGYKYSKTEILNCGVKEINYDANIPIEDSETADDKNYSYEELEELLGITILKNKHFKNNIIQQKHIEKKDGKISVAGFGITNVMNINYKNIDHTKQYEFHHLTFGFRTKYATDDCDKSWYSFDKSKFDEYYIEKLDTKAVVINKGFGHYTYKFDYDNIDYNLHFMFIPSRNWTEEKKEQRIKEIIESFEY